MNLDYTNMFIRSHDGSVLHGCDARAKILIAFTTIILLVIAQDLISVLLVFSLAMSLTFAGKVFGRMLLLFQAVAVCFLIVLLLNTWFNSFNFGLIVLLKSMILMTCLFVFLFTTSPEDAEKALAFCYLPCSVVYTMTLAIRFIPIVAAELRNIMDAQKARGFTFVETGYFRTIRNLVPIMIPLLLSSIRRSQNIGEALESRAFETRKRTSFYKPLEYDGKDWAITFLCLALLAVSLVYSWYYALLPNWMKGNLPF